MLSIVLISMVSACALPPLKQGDIMELTGTCSNCTYNNLTKVVYPNQSIALLGQYEMTKNGSNFNYSYIPNTLGTWYYSYEGDLNGVLTSQTCSFDVTYNGSSVSSGQSIIYIGLLGILIFIFLITFFGISFLPDSNARDEQGSILSISLLKYLRSTLWFIEWILFIAITYLSSNLAFAYLGEQLFAKTLFMFFRICLGITPLIVIVWFIWIFIRIKDDKELNNYMKRGMFGGKF